MDLNLNNSEFFVKNSELIAEIFKYSKFKISFTENNIWIFFDSEFYSNRYPCFDLSIIENKEIQDFFRKNKKTLVLSYNLINKTPENQNHFLYLINKNSYTYETLSPAYKRAVNKGVSSFYFEYRDWDYIKNNGYKCFNDTRNRIGFSDSRLESFEHTISKYESFKNCLPYCAIKKDSNQLASFQPILTFDIYSEIYSTYSVNEYLEFRPNDSIFYSIINHLFNTTKVQYISYGLSSIENTVQITDSLHKFKIKVGFNSVPLNRIFIMNPRYKLIFNKATISIISLLATLFKKNKLLVKLNYILKNISHLKS